MPDQIHILNVCFIVDKVERSLGGTAGNIAYTMKLLGARPLPVSAVGKDGSDYLRYFEKEGIETKYIVADTKMLTCGAYITTDVDDNQITAFYNGPSVRAREVHVRDITEPITLALISPIHKEVMIHRAKECVEAGIPVVFDPGQQITAFSPAELQLLVRQSKYLICNDYEMKLLQDKTGYNMAGLLEFVPVVITTLGSKAQSLPQKMK